MRNFLLHRLSAAALIAFLVNSPAAAGPRVLISSATDGGATWRYTVDRPGDDGAKPDFEDGNWAQGKAGFGVPDHVTPPATVGTPWKTSEIGLKRVVDRSAWPDLERYIKDIVTRFGNDRRVLIWDLYNEPGNSRMGDKRLPLAAAAFRWAREAKATQALAARPLWPRGEALSSGRDRAVSQALACAEVRRKEAMNGNALGATAILFAVCLAAVAEAGCLKKISVREWSLAQTSSIRPGLRDCPRASKNAQGETRCSTPRSSAIARGTSKR